MIPFVRNSNGNNYIRIVNGIPYLYTGVSGSGPVFEYTVCQTGTIANDYTLTFIDEAHPLYVIGSGNIGSMWGPDLYYYNNNIDPNFASCSHILFDVDTGFVARGTYQGEPITEDPFYVYPTGVTTSSPAGCELPIPELNIVQIARPSGGIEYGGVSNASGTISQTEFRDYVISGIENVWGTSFWNRMSSSDNKIWIIRTDKPSLGSGVIQSGVDLFKTYLTSQNIDYAEYFTECNNDRYLGWLADAVTYNGSGISCTGIFLPPDITANNIQGSGDNTDPGTTNKLVTMTLEGYGESGGDTETYFVDIAESVDTVTAWDPNAWSYETNGYLGEYRNLLSGGGYWDYSYKVSLDYRPELNMVQRRDSHIVHIDLECFGPPFYQVGNNKTRQIWLCALPLDEYGIPNGRVLPDNLLSEDIGSDDSGNPTTCRPEFPNIVFTSYTPTSFSTPSGTDCTQFN